MKRPPSFAALGLLVPSLSALAQAQQEAPMEQAGPGTIIAFGVITVLLIVVYVLYTRRASRKEREQEAQGK